jgi:hypothetical protein
MVFVIETVIVNVIAFVPTEERTMRPTLMTAAILAGLLAAALPAMSQPVAPAGKPSGCFFSPEFQSWKAPDDRTIYLKVRPNRFFRLDLAGECAPLRWPGSHLIMHERGSDTICTAVDWDLQVEESSPGSIPEPCIVKTMTELTPDQAAALPKGARP